MPDARREPAYADNPWVDGRLGSVRCYASVPLINPDGFTLGTLCVFDVVERSLTDEQLARLQDLGTALVALFERRRQARFNAELAVEAQNQRAQLEAAHRELSERRRELERSNAELAEFAAVASHDLRSPLAAIDGYLALLVDVYGDDIPARGRDWVGVARTAVARMLNLTESLLTYARAGASTCERQQVDLAAVVDSVLLDLVRELRAADATVHVQRPRPTVEADPVLLRQLLQNLVANAVKHREPGRKCLIDVSVEGESGGGWSRWPTGAAASRRRTGSACSACSPASTAPRPAAPASGSPRARASSSSLAADLDRRDPWRRRDGPVLPPERVGAGSGRGVGRGGT